MPKKVKGGSSSYEAMSIFDLFGSDIFGTEINRPELMCELEPVPDIMERIPEAIEAALPIKETLLEISERIAARLSSCDVPSSDTEQEMQTEPINEATPIIQVQDTNGRKKRNRKKPNILPDSYHTTTEYRFMGARIVFEDEGANEDFHVGCTTNNEGLTEAVVSSARTIFDYDDENGLPLNRKTKTKKAPMSKEIFRMLWQQEAKRRKELQTQ